MAKTENFNQERIDARDYAMQVFCGALWLPCTRTKASEQTG